MTADGRQLYGYFSRFNQPAVIDSWEGNFIERVRPGAFARTLAEKGPQVKIMYDHGRDPELGQKPLGPAVLTEDVEGGYYECDTLDVPGLDHVRAAAAANLLGSSFRFAVVSEMWRQPTRPTPDNPAMLPERDLIDVDLYELGPVVFPAYENTNPQVRGDRVPSTRGARQQYMRRSYVKSKGIGVDKGRAERLRYAEKIYAQRGGKTARTLVKPENSRSAQLEIHAAAVVLGRRNCRTEAEHRRSLRLEQSLLRQARTAGEQRSSEIFTRDGGPISVR